MEPSDDLYAMMDCPASKSEVYVPDALEESFALKRCTHLGIGAHADDLEFMALHGILSCRKSEELWFAGITCTDGSGSARTGQYEGYLDEEMVKVRAEEQRTAADIGGYSFVAQLGFASSHLKEPEGRKRVAAEIQNILHRAQPEILYTHNPFDKHTTHVGVLLATLDAIAALPRDARPKKLWGCEVWRGLDWLPDSLKVVHDVSSDPQLAVKLNAVFESQISAGKRYDLAVEGRRLANATFLDAHQIDSDPRVQYAVDLTELMEDDASVSDFVDKTLKQFEAEVLGVLKGLK